ncbi:hypothetical protein [Flavobacterium sp. B183]|uniref:hypothetical protein n=1 Tax=Flavobacterium sp. B183 TaxID=907046 RepID=UPI00201ECE88|nr:hypothetical protein [Flavobacterium sp. B183]URC11081.1 hypothetical protein M4I44_13360 [Flavobacterium sp. B183]
MKNTIAVVGLTLLLFACNSKQSEDKINTSGITKKESTHTKTSENKSVGSPNYEISTYDNPEFASNIKLHKEQLKQFSERKLFSVIHDKWIQKLSKEQQSFFSENLNYELLSMAKGNLFQDDSNDFVFIVYDKKKVKISILLYNGQTSEYAELYKDIKVENGFANTNPDAGFFRTLDYQFADEFLFYNEDALKEHPDNYLETYVAAKITDLSKDEDFALDHGSFAKNVSKTNLSNTLCLATSSVYSNWDCLRYDKTNHTFLIFYTQAFAD